MPQIEQQPRQDLTSTASKAASYRALIFGTLGWGPPSLLSRCSSAPCDSGATPSSFGDGNLQFILKEAMLSAHATKDPSIRTPLDPRLCHR
jgi:hypothetical protein